MIDHVITVEGLTKYYGGRCVLDDINVNVPRGCIYGLLGRNGAGKTTLIRILMGLENASRGSAYVMGKESHELCADDRGKIGYVAEGHHLIQDYTAGRLVGLCRNINGRWDQGRFDCLRGLFNIPLERKVKHLSTGMRAQLNLALAMSINPELLILDDPTLGLDTVVRRQFLELAIDVIQNEGRTVLFSSHILGDVERIADRVGVIAGGRLVIDCEMEELKKRIRKLRVIFPQAIPERLYLNEVIRQQRYERELTITVANWDSMKQSILELHRPESISEIPMSLEDIFVECTE